MELLVCLGLRPEICLYRETTKERVGDRVERGVSERPVLFHFAFWKLRPLLRAGGSARTVTGPRLRPARGPRTALFPMLAEVVEGSWKSISGGQLTSDESGKEVRAKIVVAMSHMDQAEL